MNGLLLMQVTAHHYSAQE